MSLLELQHISKAFHGVIALAELNFRADSGTVTSIIGPNGAGKTTLLNIISGFIRADSGTVVLDGCDITAMPAASRVPLGVARTFQQSRVFTRFSVLENLVLGHTGRMSAVARLGTGGAEFRARAASALERVGLAGYQELRAELLSNAEKRRLEVARAIMQDFRVLLLDEPTSGLDGMEREILGEDILRLREEGFCIVLVEHDVPFVTKVSDRVAVLDFGRVVAEGTPEETARDEKVVAAYLGSAHGKVR